MSPAAGAGSKGSSLASTWSGSDRHVHGKPRQSFLDKLHGRKALLVKDEWSSTICQMIDKIKWPKQCVENARSGFGLTLGLRGEIATSDPRLLTDGKLKELTRAINSMLVECLPGDFEWTPLQIYFDSVVTDQVDACQVGRVACLLLGDFVGGSLHCKLSGGSFQSDPSVVLASTSCLPKSLMLPKLSLKRFLKLVA